MRELSILSIGLGLILFTSCASQVTEEKIAEPKELQFIHPWSDLPYENEFAFFGRPPQSLPPFPDKRSQPKIPDWPHWIMQYPQFVRITEERRLPSHEELKEMPVDLWVRLTDEELIREEQYFLNLMNNDMEFIRALQREEVVRLYWLTYVSWSKFQENLRIMNEILDYLIKTANDGILQDDAARAKVVLYYLDEFAINDNLLYAFPGDSTGNSADSLTIEAGYSRSLYVSALASLYLQTINVPHDDTNILSWFSDLLDLSSHYLSRYGNIGHRVYPVLLSQLLMSLVLKDKVRWDQGIELFKSLINDFQEDGTSTIELEQANSQLSVIHNDILSKATLIAVLAEYNDIPLIREEGLNRLRHGVLQELEKPGYFESISGIEQVVIDRDSLNWAYHSIFYLDDKHPDMKTMIEAVRGKNTADYFDRIGGGLSRLWHLSDEGF